MNNENVCKYCLSDDNPEDLFHPCICNQPIHQICLINWFAACSMPPVHCLVCKTLFTQTKQIHLILNHQFFLLWLLLFFPFP